MPQKEPDLKLAGIKGKNIMGFDNIEVEFKNGHTRIYAPNGGGKSTLKKLIPACFFGISKTNRGGSVIGEKFRFIGSKGKAADTEIILQDVKGDFTVTITNHMTKDSNSINIKASDDRVLTKEWLLGFFNEAFFSAENFLSYTPKQQTELLGINPGKYDAKIKELKVSASEIRTTIKVIGEPEEIEKVERVDTYALGQEKTKIEKWNRDQDDRQAEINKYTRAVKDQASRIQAIKDSLVSEERELDDLMKLSKGLPEREDSILVDDIEAKLATADETNQQAAAYETNEQKRKKQETAKQELFENLEEQEKEIDKRTDYIKSFKLPLKGMTVDDKGGLLIKDRFLDSYSQSEQIIIVAKLNASQNPSNKTVWIDKYESLDKPNQKKIVKDLIEKGYDVITAEVGDQKEGDGSILMRDCKVVGAEKEEDDREDVL